MKIIFFGSSKYSVIDAVALHKACGLLTVVTIPDRPVGRKQILTPSPVKTFGLENNIPVLTPEKLKDAVTDIQNLHPDFLVVADYGKILPRSVLHLPRYAAINVHHSLLPKYRGPAPAPFAILAGESVSGVTLIEMNETVDAGDILAQMPYQLHPDETTDSLLITLNTLGGNLLPGVIASYVNGTIQKIKQDDTKASFTHVLSKEDGYIDLTNPPSPEQFDRMVRAYYPWPNVWSIVKRDTKALRIKFLPHQMVQMEGKTPVSLETFYAGYPDIKEKIAKLFR